ncbi:hypothetical protein C0989_006060 [Termitomyces sp. Mn162]|nr:hypothetical protein C0989_006060 [Termitomyces sp. Mn162]
MLDPCWEPRWIREEREPRFNTAPSDDLPAYDCLRLPHNETERDAIHRDFKLCFAASGDIRNLVQTINGLPAGYRGKCDILLNDVDTITVNRNLVILYALLGSGPSIEQSAEMAIHLMYSSALPPAIATYLRGLPFLPRKKEELMEFTRRIKEFYIDLHVTQFSPPLLSKGISIGVFPAFAEGCFDRVDTADITDREGIPELLADWGPMLNRNNGRACIIMHSRQWHRNRPNTTAQSNPCSAVMLIERCKKLPSLRIKLASVLTHGTKSPALMRLLESLDAFIDHAKAFREYLCAEQVDMIAKDLGLRVRQYNHVNSKVDSYSNNFVVSS